MVRKASELCLPWQGSRPSNNKQWPFPQLKRDWPYPGTPPHTHLQTTHNSPAQTVSTCPVWTEDSNVHTLSDLGPSQDPQELPVAVPLPLDKYLLCASKVILSLPFCPPRSPLEDWDCRHVPFSCFFF